MRIGAVVLLLGLYGFAAASGPFEGAGVSVTGNVLVVGKTGGAADKGDVVVWLKPVVEASGRGATESASRTRQTIVQQNKRFEPHLLVVPVGTVIDFPNLDPFFHNVFSLFDGKRFDLGLYEAGTSRSVTFTRPGVCYIFCNIHPDMSAIVVTVDTPYYAVSSPAGEVTVPNVPPGRYALSVWHERNKPERPDEFPREVTVTQAGGSLGIIRLAESDQKIVPHKNKYGHDYVAPPPASPIYKPK